MKLVFHISEDGSEIDNVQLLGIEESKLIASDRISCQILVIYSYFIRT